MKNIFLLGTTALFLAACTTSANQEQSLQERQAMIHEHGSDVMPFALEETKHVFRKTASGGVQEVYALTPNDKESIALIQEHLAEISASFNNGEFALPKQLHGEDMPGVQHLSTHPDRFSTQYISLENGAQIVYMAEDAATITAIHDWFNAQLTDHGTDAQAKFDPEDDPCLDENIPEGHSPEMWKMHNGCE